MGYAIDVQFESLTDDDIQIIAKKHNLPQIIEMRDQWEVYKKYTKKGTVLERACKKTEVSNYYKVEKIILFYDIETFYKKIKMHKESGWFEIVEELLYFLIHKAITRYTDDEITDLRLTVQGDTQGYAIGVTTEDQEGSWESLYPNVLDIHDDRLCDYFGESAAQWLIEDDCYEFDGFISSILMSKVAKRLKIDGSLQKQITDNTLINIDFNDSSYLPSGNISASEDERADAVKVLSANIENQALILDLWSDQLKGPGKNLLSISMLQQHDIQAELMKGVPGLYEHFLNSKK